MQWDPGSHCIPISECSGIGGVALDFVQGIETGKYVVVQTSLELSLHFVVPRLVPRARYPASSPWVIVCALTLDWACQAFHAGVRAAQICLGGVRVTVHSSPASLSVILLAIHLPMIAARLASAVVCMCFGLVTVSVSSVVMSGTLGPRHARGSLGYFWMSVFACAAMVGLPVGCAVGMTASLGTIVLLVL